MVVASGEKQGPAGLVVAIPVKFKLQGGNVPTPEHSGFNRSFLVGTVRRPGRAQQIDGLGVDVILISLLPSKAVRRESKRAESTIVLHQLVAAGRVT